MVNIFLKKYHEIDIDSKFFICGEWNVAIVDDCGRENFPLGKIFKKNLILNNALDTLAENNWHVEYANLNWNTVSSFLYTSAVLGTGNSSPLVTDTSLTNQTVETNEINANNCSIEDIDSQGARIFKKVYNFPKPENILQTSYSVSEIGLKNPWNNQIFTKFLLDTTIELKSGQFLRLFYNFKISSDLIPNPMVINLSSGTFNASGLLKLIGRFDDIFGSFDSNGLPVMKSGDSPRSSFMPFCENFCAEADICTNECFGTAYILTDFIEDFSLINSKLICNWVGSRLSVQNGSIIPYAYVNGNFYRDISYIFDINNPLNNQSTGGFLFTSVKTDRENTIDGWIWKFNNNQIKRFDKKIVINLRQSISRI